MSVLGAAIRDNADLHKAVYHVIGTLAAARMARRDIGREGFDYLCELSVAILPHLPPPKEQT
jgi:hypothetical protein